MERDRLQDAKAKREGLNTHVFAGTIVKIVAGDPCMHAVPYDIGSETPRADMRWPSHDPGGTALLLANVIPDSGTEGE